MFLCFSLCLLRVSVSLWFNLLFPGRGKHFAVRGGEAFAPQSRREGPDSVVDGTDAGLAAQQRAERGCVALLDEEEQIVQLRLQALLLRSDEGFPVEARSGCPDALGGREGDKGFRQA